MDLDEYRSYCDFSAADERFLRALWPHVEPHQDAIVGDFYERVLDHPSTRSIISDPRVVQRLMITLKVWMRELLCGPWDDHYVARRKRIGLVHVEVGVNHAAMFMAMTAVESRLTEIASRTVADPIATIAAVRKVTSLDLGLMTTSYHLTQAQQRIRDLRAVLVSHLPALALLVNADGVVQSATPAAEWLFRRPWEAGLHYSELLSVSLLEATTLDRYFARALAGGNDVRLPRVDLRHGVEDRHLSMTIVPFEFPEPGVILYVEDHTVAVEAERRVQQQEHLAQIGTLSATIAHELRNPLAGISGALQVIAAGMPSDDRRAPVIGKILDQVRALNRMVTDLLTYARPHASRVEDGIDLATLAGTVGQDLAADFPALEFEVVGRAVVAVDPHMTRQILLNLCQNAAQAMSGVGRIQVQVTADTITVSDSGPGLPDELRQRIFEPFFTTKLKGTGLGLPISQKVARAMGGDLVLRDDAPLGGACFDLRIVSERSSNRSS